VDVINSNNFFRSHPATADVAAICVRRNKAAQMLSISVSTLDRLVKAGDIPCFKLPGGVLFRVDALRDWAHQMELRAVQRSESPEIPPVSKPDTNGEAFTRSP
jgi:excisionase family DNA binding protein